MNEKDQLAQDMAHKAIRDAVWVALYLADQQGKADISDRLLAVLGALEHQRYSDGQVEHQTCPETQP